MSSISGVFTHLVSSQSVLEPQKPFLPLSSEQQARLDAVLDFNNHYEAALASGPLKLDFSFRTYLDNCLREFKQWGIPINRCAFKGGIVSSIRKGLDPNILADIDFEFYAEPFSFLDWSKVEEILLNQLFEAAGQKSPPSLPKQRHFLTQSGGLCESCLVQNQFSLHSIPLFRNGRLQPLEINVIQSLKTPCFSSEDAVRIERTEDGSWNFTTVGPYQTAQSLELADRGEFAIASEEWAKSCFNGWFRYVLLETRGLKPSHAVMKQWVPFNEKYSFSELNKHLDKHFFYNVPQGVLFLFKLHNSFGFRKQWSQPTHSSHQSQYFGKGINRALQLFLGLFESSPDVLKLAQLYLSFRGLIDFQVIQTEIDPWIFSDALPFDHPALQELTQLFPQEGSTESLRRYLRKQIRKTPPPSPQEQIPAWLAKRQFRKAVDLFSQLDKEAKAICRKPLYEALLSANLFVLARELPLEENQMRELAIAYFAALKGKTSFQSLQDSFEGWKRFFTHLSKEEKQEFLERAASCPVLQSPVYAFLQDQELLLFFFAKSVASKKIEQAEIVARGIELCRKFGPSFLLKHSSELFRSILLALKKENEEEALTLSLRLFKEMGDTGPSVEFFTPFVHCFRASSDERVKSLIAKEDARVQQQKPLSGKEKKLLPPPPLKKEESFSSTLSVSSSSQPKRKFKKTLQYFRDKKVAFELLKANRELGVLELESLIQMNEEDSEIRETLGFAYFLKGKDVGAPKSLPFYQKSIEHFAMGLPFVTSIYLKWRHTLGLANSRYFLFCATVNGKELPKKQIEGFKREWLMPAIQGFRESLVLLEQAALPKEDNLRAVTVSYRTLGEALVDLYKIDTKFESLKEGIEILEKAFEIPIIYTNPTGERTVSQEIPNLLILALNKRVQYEKNQKNGRAEQQALKRIGEIEKQLEVLANGEIV